VDRSPLEGMDDKITLPVLPSGAALPGPRRVVARQGWVGEKADFLSILREYSREALEVLVCYLKLSGRAI
jgi:hypothetical protein